MRSFTHSPLSGHISGFWFPVGPLFNNSVWVIQIHVRVSSQEFDLGQVRMETPIKPIKVGVLNRRLDASESSSKRPAELEREFGETGLHRVFSKSGPEQVTHGESHS